MKIIKYQHRLSEISTTRYGLHKNCLSNMGITVIKLSMKSKEVIKVHIANYTMFLIRRVCKYSIFYIMHPQNSQRTKRSKTSLLLYNHKIYLNVIGGFHIYHYQPITEHLWRKISFFLSFFLSKSRRSPCTYTTYEYDAHFPSLFCHY